MEWQLDGIVLHREALAYDARGTRVVSLTDTTTNACTGLGALARTWTRKHRAGEAASDGRYALDALGNVVTSAQVTSEYEDARTFVRRAPFDPSLHPEQP